jgi:hypothetical protein
MSAVTRTDAPTTRSRAVAGEGTGRMGRVTSDAQADPGDAGHRRPTVPLVPVLAVLLTLLLAGIAVLLWPRFAAPESAVRTGTYVPVLQAARSGVVDLTSFDHLTLDEDIEQVRRVATGDLEEESLAQLEDRRQELVDVQAVVSTEVVGAGVTRAEEDEATVVLVIQSTQQSTASPQAQVLRYRIQTELVREDGRWLLSGISGR